MSNKLRPITWPPVGYFIKPLAKSSRQDMFSPGWLDSNLKCMHDDVIKWKHFSALLALIVGNSPITGEFPSQRPVTWSFDVYFDLCLTKRLSKHSKRWRFETPFHSLWRYCNGFYKLIPLALHVRLPSVECHGALLIWRQNICRLWLCAVRQQTTVWANMDPYLCLNTIHIIHISYSILYSG